MAPEEFMSFLYSMMYYMFAFIVIAHTSTHISMDKNWWPDKEKHIAYYGRDYSSRVISRNVTIVYYIAFAIATYFRYFK